MTRLNDPARRVTVPAATFDPIMRLLKGRPARPAGSAGEGGVSAVRVVVHAGDVLLASSPIVKGREGLFGPLEAATSA